MLYGVNVKKEIILFAAAVSLFVSGPVFADMKYPNWLLGKSPQFPDDKFVIAVGEAADLSSSKNAAYDELKKLFKARVEQIMNEGKKMKPGAKKKEETLTPEQQQAQQKKMDEMNQYVDDLIDKAKIQDTWYNGKKNDYYALAALEKKDYDEVFKKNIARFDDTIKTALAASESSTVYLEKVKYLSIALRYNERRIDMVNMKRVIDPLAVGLLSAGLPRADIEKKKAELLPKVLFVVFDESEPRRPGMQEAVEAGITKAGFILGDRQSVNAASTVLLKYGLVVKTPKDAKPGKKTSVNWVCRFQLVEGTGKKMLSRSSVEGQVTQETEKAQEEAVVTAKKVSPVAAVGFIKNYIAGIK
jgi:hypothetical protein